jgi:AbrB family looped-hinge helix DNA binding protein
MTTSTLSPKYQIVIPKEIRNLFRLKPGQCLQVSAKGTHIEVRPILGPNELIGMLKSNKPLEFERDADRDLSPSSGE